MGIFAAIYFAACRTGICKNNVKCVYIFAAIYFQDFFFLVNIAKINWLTVFEPRHKKTNILNMRNKDAAQLPIYREADQRLCFRYTDSTIPLLSKSEISNL